MKFCSLVVRFVVVVVVLFAKSRQHTYKATYVVVGVLFYYRIESLMRMLPCRDVQGSVGG